MRSEGYRYKCFECGLLLKRKTGVMARGNCVVHPDGSIHKESVNEGKGKRMKTTATKRMIIVATLGATLMGQARAQGTISTPVSTSQTCTVSGPITQIPTCGNASGSGSGKVVAVVAGAAGVAVVSLLVIWIKKHHRKAAPSHA